MILSSAAEVATQADAQIAWAAGFFEGEGCLCIERRRMVNYNLAARVAQVDREPLERFRTLFGGRTINKKVTGNRKQRFEWRVYGKEAIGFLCTIRKYVVRSRITERILWASAFEAIRTDDSLATGKRREQMADYYQRFRVHNKKGLTAPGPANTRHPDA